MPKYVASWKKNKNEHPVGQFKNVITLAGRISNWYDPEQASNGQRSTWNFELQSQYGTDRDVLLKLIYYIYEKGGQLNVTTSVSYEDFLSTATVTCRDEYPRLKRRADQMFGFAERTEDQYLAGTLAIRGQQKTKAEAETKSEVERIWRENQARFSPQFKESLIKYYPGIALTPFKIDQLSQEHLVALKKDLTFFLAVGEHLPTEDLCAQLDTFVADTADQRAWQTQAERVVREVTAQRSVGMLLSGEAGQGKTHLAVAVAKECMMQGLTPRYIKPETLRNVNITKMIGAIPVNQRIVWIVDDCNSPYGQTGALFRELTIAANQRGDALLVTSNTCYQAFKANAFVIDSEDKQRILRRADQMFGFAERTEDQYLAGTLAIRGQQKTKAEAETKSEVERIWRENQARFSPQFKESLIKYYPGIALTPFKIDQLSQEHLVALKKDLTFFLAVGEHLPTEDLCAQLDTFVADTADQRAWQTQAERVVREVTAQRSVGMLLSGEAGQGKTHLAVAVAKECMMQGLTPRYIKPETLRNVNITKMIGAIPVNQRIVWIVDDCNSPYGQTGALFRELTIAANQRGDALLVTSNTSYRDFSSTALSLSTQKKLDQAFFDAFFAQESGDYSKHAVEQTSSEKPCEAANSHDSELASSLAIHSQQREPHQRRSFDLFKQHYKAQYEKELFKNPWSKMKEKLKNGEITSIEQVEDYVKQHPNTRSAKVLSKMK